MRKIIWLIYFTSTAPLFSPLLAQKQFHTWVASINSFKLNKKTSVFADISFRSTDRVEQLQTFLFSTGVFYKISKHVTLSQGATLSLGRKNVAGLSGLLPEYRTMEQVLFNYKLKKISVIQRLRLEQRFIPKSVAKGNKLTTDGYSFASRFRFWWRNILPLQKGTSFKKGVYAALQNELLINLGDKSAVNGETFDQNRLYLATGYRLNPKIDLEIGYMNQYVNGKGTSFTNNHIIQLVSYLRL